MDKKVRDVLFPERNRAFQEEAAEAFLLPVFFRAAGHPVLVSILFHPGYRSLSRSDPAAMIFLLRATASSPPHGHIITKSCPYAQEQEFDVAEGKTEILFLASPGTQKGGSPVRRAKTPLFCRCA
jgi:hypothetical protein